MDTLHHLIDRTWFWGLLSVLVSAFVSLYAREIRAVMKMPPRNLHSMRLQYYQSRLTMLHEFHGNGYAILLWVLTLVSGTTLFNFIAVITGALAIVIAKYFGLRRDPYSLLLMIGSLIMGTTIGALLSIVQISSSLRLYDHSIAILNIQIDNLTKKLTKGG
jgi:hypothetical protein